MDRPRLYVDLNEMIEPGLYLLSKTDIKMDSAGNAVELREGVRVHVYMDDRDEAGRPDNLIADGVVEPNHSRAWSPATKWCVRIDGNGLRHESDPPRDR